MNQLWLLFRLQQTDSKLAAVEQQLAGLVPSAEIVKAISIRERKLKEASEQHHHLKVALKDAELKMASVAEHRKGIEKKLYDGTTTNTKELGGFQKEAEQLKVQESQLEDKALELMEQVDAQATEIEALKARLEKGRKALDNEKATQEKTHVDLEQQLDELRKKREAMIAELEPVLVTRYEGLRKRKQGVAVALLRKSPTGEACGECGVTLPEPLIRRVKDRQIEICLSCERILFAEEKLHAH